MCAQIHAHPDHSSLGHTHPGLGRTVLPAAHNVGHNMSLLLSCGRAQQPVAQPDPAGSTVPAQGGLKPVSSPRQPPPGLWDVTELPQIPPW